MVGVARLHWSRLSGRYRSGGWRQQRRVSLLLVLACHQRGVERAMKRGLAGEVKRLLGCAVSDDRENCASGQGTKVGWLCLRAFELQK